MGLQKLVLFLSGVYLVQQENSMKCVMKINTPFNEMDLVIRYEVKSSHDPI